MNEAFSIGFTPLAGTAETRWLRLVQVGADDDIVTMDEAAELIDALYKISPCDTGTGGSGGGENAPEEPTEEEFAALSAEALGELCEGQDHWDVQVDLLRSHPSPAAWRVQAGDAEHVSTEIVVETRTETVSLDGADHHDLERPYHAGLRVVGAEVADVRGSTVNFARPVTGRVRLTYTTRFERLTLRVPATPDEHGQAQAEPASVIAFWDRRAAQLELKQPEPDDGVSAAELERLCRGKDKDKDKPSGGCWERLSHYSLCHCNESPAPDSEWEEEVGANCPEGVKAGTFLGTRRVLDSYTRCEGEEDELRDPEYYKKTCCKSVPTAGHLPLCRESRRVYRGGAPIEGGADSWRERYGEDVVLTAVSPPDGVCGKEITKWHDEQRNCCDDIIPMSPHPENPTEIQPGQTVWVGVRDGRYPGRYEWTAHGGLVFADTDTTRLVTAGPGQVRVTTQANVCPRPRIEVDDGCDVVRMTFSSPGGEPVFLSREDMAADPETRFSLAASGGVPPYMWMAVDIDMLGYSADGATAMFQTRVRDAWCVATITVTDQCGQTATCSVRNALTGRWKAIDYDTCAPLVAAPLADPTSSSGWTEPRNGIRLNVGYDATTSSTPSFRCPVGNKAASNMDDVFLRHCKAWMAQTQYQFVSCEGGVCVKVFPSTGRLARAYYSSYINGAQQWLCN